MQPEVETVCKHRTEVCFHVERCSPIRVFELGDISVNRASVKFSGAGLKGYEPYLYEATKFAQTRHKLYTSKLYVSHSATYPVNHLYNTPIDSMRE